MTAIRNLTTRRQLSQAWREWTDIVRLLAEKPSASDKISEFAYRKLHQEVTALVNGLRERSSETDSRGADLSDQLNELVRPWMTLAALRDADEWIRKSVLLQCQDCQREIDAPVELAGMRIPSEPSLAGKPKTAEQTARRQSVWGLVAFTLLFFGVFAIGLGSEFWSEIRQITWISSLTDGLGTSWHDMMRTDDVNFVLIRRVTVVIVILTAWVVFRPPRNY